MSRFLDKKFFWICVEGVDCTGKTSLCNHLYRHLKESYKHSEVKKIEEFSDGRVGTLIKEVIEDNFFLSLEKEKGFPISETFLLLSDLVYQFEKKIKNAEEESLIVISDRGWLTFYVYQFLRLNRKYDKVKWKKQLDNFISGFLSSPDLTIILDERIDKIKKRIFFRDGVYLKDEDIDQLLLYKRNYYKFINKKNTLFLKGEEINYNKIKKELDKVIKKAL